MATSVQDRLKKLLPNRPKPTTSTTHRLPLFEQELLEYKQRQQKAAEPPPAQVNQDEGSSAEEDDFVRAHAPPKPKSNPNNNPSRGTDPDQVVFLPKGVWRGGLPATQVVDDDHDDQRHREPISSSHQRIGRFCVWSLVAKFPYKYMQDPDSKVSKRFFASEKVFERGWHVHYMFAPESCGFKPLILVPFDQLETLIQDISTEFDLQVKVPAYPFQLSFYDDGTPQPQSLGTVNSKDDMAEAQSKIPEPPADYDQVPVTATKLQKQDHEAWREKAERAFEAEKKKKSAIKKKKTQKRDMTVMENVNQLKRAQRYLGMRQKLPTTEVVRPAQGSDEQAQQAKQADIFPEALDVERPAPFPFEDQTVVVAIDVESWEMDHNIITEIGVSTLDTAALVDVAPGKQGEEWVRKIRSRHFRIKGREALRNFKYVHGNPDMFQFGTSEFVAIDEAAEVVDSCFEFPFSAGFECAGPPDVDAEGLPVPRKAAVLDTSHKSGGDDSRNLLLIGHDINGDITYLSTLGSFIFGSGPVASSPERTASRRHKVLSSIRERLDTVVLHKSLSKDDQAKSLMKLCHELHITAWYAHNAGNDARYTLEAFIKLVIKAREEEDSANALARETGNYDVEKTLWELEKEQRINAKIEAARQEIETELAAYEKAGAPGTRRRSPSPFFANSEDPTNASTEGNPGNITFDEATRRYLEKSGGAPSATDQAPSASGIDILDGGSPTKAFEQVVDEANAAKEVKKVKKSAEQKRREDEMEVRIDGGQGGQELGPCEWAPDGKDGCAK
ncbi:hypothetical protein PMZ80_007723 [Knufia obscura]|uniref:Gfd2/YDR514C-like C-terminal domain-containing protein n=1 Tax=Knufia obscura TaxID=1635080 RepID=A0ABR0RI45_9EURO|nr:hypothetical protein PMZ80_007723 [Knufia obscura]